MPNRHGTNIANGYRYGFQGQEMDNEIKGEGNSLNYTFRMHDPRVGRFFAIDPLSNEYPFYSPYQFNGNSPIMSVELEGLEPSVDPNQNQQKNTDTWTNRDGSTNTNLDEVVITVQPKAESTSKKVNTWVDKNIGQPARSVAGKINNYVDKNIGQPARDFVKPAGQWTSDYSSAHTSIGAGDIWRKHMGPVEDLYKIGFGPTGVGLVGIRTTSARKVILNTIEHADEVVSQGQGYIWNLGQAVITKAHHNWNKIFGNQAISLTDVEPFIKKAVEKGTWEVTGIIRGRKGVIIGDKLELLQEIEGHQIWVGGMKEHSTGKIYINNAAVK
ncbi:RHS repeat-associated core domain-containing protein [Flavobacterium suncheonense]|uniref:RHS repeat-associated core domain-containing protein n=1 Tax=Flavobacterium suncheonense TaxID=350894 RepID=UPI0021CD586D|nr:RHS repeat-associated core domain-containing protein [Flavobacterium suncheonense]